MARKKKSWQKLETKVQNLLQRAGFDCPDHTRKIEIGNQVGHQIDAIGWYENVLVVVECTGRGSRGKRQLRNRIKEVSEELRDIKQWWRQQGVPHPQARAAIATRHIDITDNDKDYARRKRIAIWDDASLKYFRQKTKALGAWTKNEILWDLGIRKSAFKHDPIHIEGAIEVRQKRRKLYTFPITPKDLLSISFVHRRDPSYPAGYQRIIFPDKIRRLREYLESRHGVLPNSIIVNFIHAPRFTAYPGLPRHGVRVGRLTIERNPCSAWIIDGQHRLMAFADTKTQLKAGKFKLITVGFAELDQTPQAKLFLTINETQKRISPSLVYALASELFPKEPRGVASRIVKELAGELPFRGCIATEPWQRAPIRLANFADSLRRSRLVPQSRDQLTQSLVEELPRQIRRFYKRLLRRHPESRPVRQFFLSNNGVAVLMRVVKRGIDCSQGRLVGVKLDAFIRAVSGFNWRRSVSESAYSSEADRQKLAVRIMRRVRRRCSWFSLP